MSAQNIATLGVAIVGSDKTKPAFDSVEKRAGKAGATAAKKIGEGDRAATRVGGFRNMARTFLDVERAASKAFGGSSAFSLIGSRAAGLRAVGSALGSGLGRASVAMGSVETAGAGAASQLGATAAAGEKAAAGMAAAGVAGAEAAGGMEAAAGAVGGLAAALGPVGVGLAAVVAIGGAAAFATYKMAAGWAYGGAELGRLSDRIGIAVEDIQKLQQAGERFGISKDATAGALDSFSKTTNDAFNARNPQARVLLRKGGVEFKRKADGTLDYAAMLPGAERFIQAQKDPVIQSMVADQLGLGAMLPLLRKGPQAVKRETDDVAAHGAVASAADTDQARAFVYNATVFGQLARRQTQKAQVGATKLVVPAIGGAVAAGQTLTDASEDPAKRNALVAAGADKAAAVGNAAIGGLMNILMPPAEAMGRAGGAMYHAAETQRQAANTMLRAATAVGGDSQARFAAAVEYTEARNNPTAHPAHGSALGLDQFTADTWLGEVRRHGAAHGLGWAADAIKRGQAGPRSAMRAKILALRADPATTRALMTDLTRDNANTIRPVLGHDPSPEELYMAHFLGSGGASKFFRLQKANPNASAAAAFPAEVGNNYNIFYDKKTGRARSFSEVEQIMDKRIEIGLTVTGLPAGTKVTAKSRNAVAVSHATVGKK